MSITDSIFGKPLATEEEDGERVGPLAGVPILGLDALASAAYGPEALLTVLLPLGIAGLHYLPLLTLLIIAVLAIVYVSYRQTLHAYPNGGGSYTVAKENLGTKASLVAAAALALDYVLNVAVAISAGVGALASAVPGLLPYTLPLCLGLLALLTIVNLRGVRATGFAFMLPTYVFVGSLFVVIGVGVFKAVTHGGHVPPVVAPPSHAGTVATVSLWMIVRAFSSGCTALTGVEAVSNGVPIFCKPSHVGARRTLAMIVGILVTLLAGVAFLCRTYNVTATPPGEGGYQSVLSQAVAATVGNGAFYYVVMASIVTVLCLSANTSFADFPRLCRLLALDKFMPELFVHRGRRLTFSHGIIGLSLLSGLLLIVFGGITDALIPLFAIGAFLAFTMSQSGMVVHWRKRLGTEAGARRSIILNGVGAAVTGVLACVILAAKFLEGAWISVLLMLGMLLLFRQVRRHYDLLHRLTFTEATLEMGPPRPPVAVVPLRRWDAVTLKALRFAVGLTPDVIAVQVLTGDREVDNLTECWGRLAEEPVKKLGLAPPRLMVLRSEYRQLFAPLLGLVTDLAKEHPDRQIAVIVPELVEKRWYHYLLHNHSAAMLKALLLFRGGPRVVVINTPWYLAEWFPERVATCAPVTPGQRRRKSLFGRWRAAGGAIGRVLTRRPLR